MPGSGIRFKDFIPDHAALDNWYTSRLDPWYDLMWYRHMILACASRLRHAKLPDPVNSCDFIIQVSTLASLHILWCCNSAYYIYSSLEYSRFSQYCSIIHFDLCNRPHPLLPGLTWIVMRSCEELLTWLNSFVLGLSPTCNDNFGVFEVAILTFLLLSLVQHCLVGSPSLYCQ